MSKGKVVILSAQVLAPAGSDHLPILVDFGIDDTDCCLPVN
jgi:endonuclease/exonuclease/phosphatase (EEP) superfamily protein YafD